MVAPGTEIFAKGGVYTNKGGTTGYYARYNIQLYGDTANPITIRPEQVGGVSQHVEIDGQLYLTDSTCVEVYDIDFNQTTAIPASEPSGISTGSNPAELIEWGARGVHFANSNGCKAINCQVRGRGGAGFQSYQAANWTVYGGISVNAGWEAPDGFHNHGFYGQNDETDPSDVLIKHGFFTTRAATRAPDNAYAGHIYGESNPSNNITQDANYYLGANTTQNLNHPQKGIVFKNNITQSGLIGATSGADSKGSSLGRATLANVDCECEDNKWIDTRVRVINGNWSSLTMTATRNILYKMTGAWWGTSANHSFPALPHTELITFTDHSGGGGTDAYQWWLNDYDSNQARLVILALNTADNSVDVDPSSFLSSGDTYSMWRFSEAVNIWGSPDISGTWTSGNITIALSDSTIRSEGLIVRKS